MNTDIVWQIDFEQPGDVDGIHQVHQQAFDRPGEAEVVDRLRQDSPVFLSYVARSEGQILGHVLFTPACILQPDGSSLTGLGLAPLAVLPNFQGQGIGSALCREGLRRIDPALYPFVIVLGHPGYYPRFGFKPAANYGVQCAYEDIPDDCFMILILDHEKMSGVSGVALYRPEFDSVS
jgi:putative acetyltransferase